MPLGEVTVYNGFLMDETDPQAAQPGMITAQLKPHQLTAVAKMAELESRGMLMFRANVQNGQLSTFRMETNLGVLADKVGYGKTLTMLALIASNKNFGRVPERHIVGRPENHNGQRFMLREVQVPEPPATPYLNPTLIVVPHGPVFGQWEATLKTHTKLKFMAFQRKKCLDALPSRDAATLKETINGQDVILLSGSFHKTWQTEVPCLQTPAAWRRVVVDEAHGIRVAGLTALQAKFSWFITATPLGLYNPTSPGFIKHNFFALPPLAMSCMTVRSKDEYLQASFNIPAFTTHRYLCRLLLNMNGLLRFIPAEVVNMLNANDVEAAVVALGGRAGVDTDIIDLITKDLQKDIHNKNLEIDLWDQMQIPAQTKRTRLQKLRSELDCLQDKMACITERLSNLDSQECTICFCNFEDPVSLGCTHVFCAGCIFQWMRSCQATYAACPACKLPINPSAIFYMTKGQDKPSCSHAEPVVEDMSVPKLNKVEAALKIIEGRPDGKFIIFSNHYGSFTELQATLSRKGVSNRVLMGQASQQNKIVTDFKAGNLRVIMLNSWHSGSGIDLHFATDIITYQKLDQILETQVLGRANRPGRTSGLRVHNLLHSNELDADEAVLDNPSLTVMR